MGTITAEVVETGETHDRRGRRAMPRTRRLELIQAFRASGLTMAKFARQEGINYTTFAGWVHRTGAVAAGSPIRFAQVQVPTAPAGQPAAGPLEVRLADGTVVRGERVAEVVAVVRALRA
jgi:transposase-like protein